MGLLLVWRRPVAWEVTSHPSNRWQVHGVAWNNTVFNVLSDAQVDFYGELKPL